MAGGSNIFSARQITPERVAYQPTGFKDSVVSSLMASSYSLPHAMPLYDEVSDYGTRVDEIKKRFGESVVDEIKKNVDDELQDDLSLIDALPFWGQEKIRRNLEKRYELFNSRINEVIESGKAENPEKWQGIRTNKEIRDEIKRKAILSEEISADVMRKNRSDLSRYGGLIVGSIGGAFTDPVNLATLPIGAASSMRILTAIGSEALANMAIEAMQTPSYVAWQKELGNDLSAKDIALNIVTAGAGAGALTGIVRGTSGAVKFIGSKSSPIFQAIGDNASLPSSIRSAAKYMAKTKHIDENIFDELIGAVRAAGKSDSAARAINRANLEKTATSIENRTEPRLYDDIPFDLAEKNISKAPPSEFNLGEPTGAFYKNYTPVTAQDIRYLDGLNQEAQSFKTGELVFIERDFQGSTPDVFGIKSEAPKWFQDLKAARKEIDKVTKKLKDGAPLGKREAVVADTLMAEVKASRQKNIEQYQQIKEMRKYDDEESINAIAQREASEIDMDDELNEAYRYEANSLDFLKRQVDETNEEVLMPVFNAEFERMLVIDPEKTIEIEGKKITLSELKEFVDEDKAVIDAIKTCALG